MKLRHWLWTLAVCAGSLQAQEDHTPQFHGFFTQAFTYSGDNNYLGMNSGSGSLGWTEGALNVNERVTENLRVGAQIHMTRLGKFGEWTPTLDWALADYKLKPWLRFRAGKVKIRWGLYNDTQDADPGYLWSLLPEPVYAVDFRATNLSQWGGEAYGNIHLGSRGGELGYSVYHGYYWDAPNDGYMEQFHESGEYFSKRPGGITPGFDLRWKTPLTGFTLGGSLMFYDAHGTLVDGSSYQQPLTFWPTYYAQYERGKLTLSGQYVRLVQWTDTHAPGAALESSVVDSRAWFITAAYHLTDKLQVGGYYTHYIVAGADLSDPANRYRDWVVSTRYEFNRFFYSKLEGHWITGNGVGFYGFDNPNGLASGNKLLVVKLGFCF